MAKILSVTFGLFTLLCVLLFFCGPYMHVINFEDSQHVQLNVRGISLGVFRIPGMFVSLVIISMIILIPALLVLVLVKSSNKNRSKYKHSGTDRTLSAILGFLFLFALILAAQQEYHTEVVIGDRQSNNTVYIKGYDIEKPDIEAVVFRKETIHILADSKAISVITALIQKGVPGTFISYKHNRLMGIYWLDSVWTNTQLYYASGLSPFMD